MKMKSWATKQIGLAGWTKEESIREIAHMDGVSLTEAKSRYETAKKTRLNRSIAQSQRRFIEKMAKEHARAGQFNESFSRKYPKTYRKVFFAEEKKAGKRDE